MAAAAQAWQRPLGRQAALQGDAGGGMGRGPGPWAGTGTGGERGGASMGGERGSGGRRKNESTTAGCEIGFGVFYAPGWDPCWTVRRVPNFSREPRVGLRILSVWARPSGVIKEFLTVFIFPVGF